MGKSAAMIRRLKTALPFASAPSSDEISKDESDETTSARFDGAAWNDDEKNGDEENGPAESRGAEDGDGVGDSDAADEKGDGLEAGIASIFAAIRSGKTDEALDVPALEETGATYELLAELDRLWQGA